MSVASLGSRREYACALRGYLILTVLVQVGHRARECPNESVCNSCGMPGHFASSCRAGRGDSYGGGFGGGGGMPDIVCNNCRGRGHKARDCTSPPVCKRQPRAIPNTSTQGMVFNSVLVSELASVDCPVAV